MCQVLYSGLHQIFTENLPDAQDSAHAEDTAVKGGTAGPVLMGLTFSWAGRAETSYLHAQGTPESHEPSASDNNGPVRAGPSLMDGRPLECFIRCLTNRDF